MQLAKALFAERGVQETSMRDLADAAGILPSSLYSHFKSKEGLADEILHAFLHDMLEQFQTVEADIAKPFDRVRTLVGITVGRVDSDSAALSIYRRDFEYLVTLPRFSYLYDLHLSIRTIWLAAIEGAMADGDLRADVEPVVFYRWVRDALTSMPRWPRGEARPTVTELTSFAERVFLEGMGTRP